MPLDPEDELALRFAIFDLLERWVDEQGGWLTHRQLVEFQLEGRSFPLIDYSRGIRNPRELAATLSVVSSDAGPYSDHIDESTGLIDYAFRTGAADAGDNRKLVEAYRLRHPIIVFRKPMPDVYIPLMPSTVVGMLPGASGVRIAFDQGLARFAADPAQTDVERRYVERVIKQRLHQPAFRARVLRAYRRTCAICRLQLPPLLDAAHIIGDGRPGGDPVVQNGLALCKIHHKAFDEHLLGITPTYLVHVAPQVLEVQDGPMLRHGLQEMHGVSIEDRLPTRISERPDPDRLDAAYQDFLAHA